MCDVSIDSTDANIAYLTLTNGFGLDLATQYDTFDEGDDWIWGTISGPLVGKCDGTDSTSDGSNELQKRLNNPILVGQQPIYGYTDIELKEFAGDEYDEDAIYRLYWDVTGNADSCLTHDRLNYYLGESDEIIYTYEGQGGERPVGKDFIRVVIIDATIPHSGGSWYAHYYQCNYGIPYYTPPSN